MFKISYLCLIGFTLLLTSLSCNAEEKHLPGMPYYYESFSHYKFPYKPTRPIAYEEAIKRKAYYIAYYDDKNKLISFTKYLSGKLIFSVNYFYRDSGTVEHSEDINEVGERKIQYFDENGNHLK